MLLQNGGYKTNINVKISAMLRSISVWRVCVCVCVSELEVARLSTDGNLADLTFPQSELHGNSIQLSASTLKQHGRNGRSEM